MKKSLLTILILLTAALSVMSASAAPRGRYYDQLGNKYWCNVDDDGCWVTGEEGERIYIMFWSEAAAAKFMGEGVKAPIGIRPAGTELTLDAPLPAAPCDPTGERMIRECSPGIPQGPCPPDSDHPKENMVWRWNAQTCKCYVSDIHCYN